MADPYRKNVVLYLPMEGSHNGSTVFTDKTGRTILVSGNTHLSTAVKPPFGFTSAYFDGSGDYLYTYESSNDLDLHEFNFTVEYKFYGSARANRIISKHDGGSNGGWLCIVTPGTSAGWAQWTAAGTYDGASGPAPLVNAWNHIAVCRIDNTVTVYTNGVGGVPVTTTNRPANTDPSRPLQIGVYQTLPTTDPTLGYVKEVRITKGVARYTGNFYVDWTPFQWDELDQPRIML